MGKLGDRVFRNRLDPVQGINWTLVFGLVGPGHGLAYPCEAMSVNADEPRFTRAFAGVMDETRIFPIVAHARAVSFLRAVASRLGDEFMPPDYGTPVTVTAEQKNKEGDNTLKPRLDLCFQWNAGGCRKVLGIEVKFGANGLQKNQIEDYSKIMKSLKREPFGVFLSCRSCRPEELSNEVIWRQLRWWSVMRAWENELASAPGAEPAAFGSFRASLWEKILKGYVS